MISCKITKNGDNMYGIKENQQASFNFSERWTWIDVISFLCWNRFNMKQPQWNTSSRIRNTSADSRTLSPEPTVDGIRMQVTHTRAATFTKNNNSDMTEICLYHVTFVIYMGKLENCHLWDMEIVRCLKLK